MKFFLFSHWIDCLNQSSNEPEPPFLEDILRPITQPRRSTTTPARNHLIMPVLNKNSLLSFCWASLPESDAFRDLSFLFSSNVSVIFAAAAFSAVYFDFNASLVWIRVWFSFFKLFHENLVCLYRQCLYFFLGGRCFLFFNRFIIIDLGGSVTT